MAIPSGPVEKKARETPAPPRRVTGSTAATTAAASIAVPSRASRAAPTIQRAGPEIMPVRAPARKSAGIITAPSTPPARARARARRGEAMARRRPRENPVASTDRSSRSASPVASRLNPKRSDQKVTGRSERPSSPAKARPRTPPRAMPPPGRAITPREVSSDMRRLMAAIGANRRSG